MEKRTIFGCPGTGKTSYLINEIIGLLNNGTYPSDIRYMSFTKSAVGECVERISEKTGRNKHDFKGFKTIHSSCFSELGLSKDLVFSEEHLEELSDKVGYKLKNNIQCDSIFDLPKGDLALQLNNLARMRMIPIRTLYDEFNLALDYNELIYISDEYDKFKAKNGLIDYTGMLERYLEKGIPTSEAYIYVDEAQDLSLLQWKVVERMAGYSDVLTVAGDDDQAIYQWNGADVDYFLDFAQNSKKVILDKSYRCRENIRDYSLNIIKKVSRREPKTYQPVSAGGEIESYSDLSSIDMSKGQWRILVRNNYFQKKAIEYCRNFGHYYSSTTYDGTKNLVADLLCYEDLRKGKDVDTKQFIKMLGNITASGKKYKYLLENNYKNSDINLQTCSILGVDIDFEKPWFDAFRFANYNDLCYLRSALRNRENLRKAPRIEIESIHSAKGKEADNVALLLDISKKTYQGMQNFPDPELRCLYVATTRAKDKLAVVLPDSKYFYNL